MNISSEHDMEEVRRDIDTMLDSDLLDEAALYDKLSEQEAAYQNWYAADLYQSAYRMFIGEYYDRIERRRAKARAAEARRRKAASTIGQRICPETRAALLALRQQLSA